MAGQVGSRDCHIPARGRGLILSYVKIKGRGVEGEGAVSFYVKSRGIGMNDRGVGRRNSDDGMGIKREGVYEFGVYGGSEALK